MQCQNANVPETMSNVKLAERVCVTGTGYCETSGRLVRRAQRKLAEVKPRVLHAAQNASPKRPQEDGQQGGIKGGIGGHSNCNFARRPGFRGALALALAFLKT